MILTHRVIVEAYSTTKQTGDEGKSRVYCGRSTRSPGVVSRELASIIHGKSQLALTVRNRIPAGFAGRYFIETEPTGKQLALIPFREKYNLA